MENLTRPEKFNLFRQKSFGTETVTEVQILSSVQTKYKGEDGKLKTDYTVLETFKISD